MMADDDYFGKLAEGVCNNSAEETWLNVYGRDFQDLLVIDLDRKVAQIDPIVDALVEPYFSDMDLDSEAAPVLCGLRELRTVISGGEYPRVTTTVTIMTILKEAVEKPIDSLLITESYRLLTQLLHSSPPSTDLLMGYWDTALVRLLVGKSKNAEVNTTRIRESFIALIKTVTTPKDDERQRLAATAFLRLLCELLEMDFAFFLDRHSRDASTAMFNKKTAPWIAALFWPHEFIQIGCLQTDFLQPMVKALVSGDDQSDFAIRDVYSRLLAMVFELVRLTEKDEKVEAVSCQKTPERLYRLLAELYPVLRTKEKFERFSRSTAFGWVKRAIRERESEVGNKR